MKWKWQDGGWYDGPIYDIVDVDTDEDICSTYDNKQYAQLIATAPELLEQLEKLADQFEFGGFFLSLSKSDKDAIQEARSVIAKAKGTIDA